MSDNIIELLFKMPNIIFTVGGVVALVSILGDYIRRAHQASLDNTLKRELVAQGRSAEDIERILSASSKGKRKNPEC
jgi:hypothetical protein